MSKISVAWSEWIRKLIVKKIQEGPDDIAPVGY